MEVLIQNIKKTFPDSIFYDNANYISLNLGNHRISLICNADQLLFVAPTDNYEDYNFEIISEPYNENFPETSKATDLIKTLLDIQELARPEETYEGFDESGEDDENSKDYSGMPELTVDNEREITIISWGKKHHKSAPNNSELNVNAGLLSGKKEGLDLKNMDGRNKEIQNRVIRARIFYDVLTKTIEKIEKDDLHTISVNCTAGRHRSVAFAELLKKHYYQHATIIHLDL